MADGDILYDAELVPDKASLREMGAEAPIVDSFRGSCILIVRRGVVAAEGVATVDLLCSFLPAEGTRVVSADVMISLLQPQGAMFIDIAPREIKEPAQVEITREIGGKFLVKHGPLNAEAAGKQNAKTSYSTFLSRVRGVGAGSVRANWRFEEDAHAKNGIGAEQPLLISFASARTVKGEFIVTARLARNGVIGPTLDMLDALTHADRRAEVLLYAVV